MGREVDKIPGALWNFSQPIADNMEEAVSGVKGELAIKIFGTDLTGTRSQRRRDYPRDEPDSRAFRTLGCSASSGSRTSTSRSIARRPAAMA